MSELPLNRRQLLASAGVLLAASRPSQAEVLHPNSTPILSGTHIQLHIQKTTVNFTGRPRQAITVNGSLPAPTLHLKEGDTVTIEVINHLDEMTAIHWHGLLLPSEMDGVPDLSFSGIAAHSRFTYQFTLQQNGTYWYHAHAGFQEQLGLYGAIVIRPREPEPKMAEHIIMLSDWTDLAPQQLLAKLKKQSHFDNQHPATVQQFFQDVAAVGWRQAWQKRQMWQQMRMRPTDLADLTAGSFLYLLNGKTSATPWQAPIEPDQPLKLRLINASAQTIFDVRIPHLPLTVVATDGQAVHPVQVDELRIAPAETYDLIIRPSDSAYTFFAQNIDRSGYVHGFLQQHTGLTADIPPLDPPEWLSMQDMMGEPASQPQIMGADAAMSHHHHHDMMDMGNATPVAAMHHPKLTDHNPFVDMRVPQPRRNLDDAGVNLRHNLHKFGRRVLTYADLRTLDSSEDPRPPSRIIELRLTGNMERYVWGFDGVSYPDAQPIALQQGERVRFRLINDTMMTHPIHLHGMWSELRDEHGHFQVRKHTLMVQPAQQIEFDVTAIVGRWAFHCHLLYHMETGMFREVRVSS